MLSARLYASRLCRDHILNIKDAPAPKAAGKGAKRTLEQATAVPPPAPLSPPPQPPSDTAAQAAAPAVSEEAGPSATESVPTDQQPAVQEQPGADVVEERQPGVQEAAEATGSDLQAGNDMAAATAPVSCIFLSVKPACDICQTDNKRASSF